eukprot:6478629-Amphidinium_carterae.1
MLITKSSGTPMHLCKGVADTRPDFQTLKQLKLDGESQRDTVKIAPVHAESGVGDLCVRCGEAMEDLEHIVHHCPAWNGEQPEVGIPASALEAASKGLVLSCMVCCLLRKGRCGVGYYTDIGESAWLPLPGLKQSAYRAELLATVRALAECQPMRL